MDDIASDILISTDEVDDHDDETQQQNTSAGGDSAKTARSLRRGIFRAASLQDKLLEKLLSQVIPVDDIPPNQAQPVVPDMASSSSSAASQRPGFTVSAMSTNFRRFNARIGVVFKFQSRAIRLFTWRRPTHTLSFLAVYTFICLDPYLLFALPLAISLLSILVPSFIARHPPSTPSPSSTDQQPDRLGYYTPRGPPLAPARTVKPAKELSRDFFRNLGDLQNCMDDFSVAHDKIVAVVVPKTNFSDEALSSAVFVLLSAACAFMTLAAHLLPWRFMALAAGWAAICSSHPAVARLLARSKSQYLDAPQEAAEGAFDAWVRSDIILDEAPETREVEIFELQRLMGGGSGGGGDDDGGGEWEPWLFSPSPYDPLSAARISGDRPRGTRFFEDVMAPDGWEWSGKKWALDLWSREWVEERIITGVEVETEGERWVYDIYNEHGGGGDDQGGGDVAYSPVRNHQRPAAQPNGHGPGQGQPPTLSWEEGEEGMGRRGEWRRRRWVRMVRRRNVTGS
ncbi:Peroxin/Dysferlin domain-containing protein [Bombardia bombarda]|uniref:Peroxin/Dysferlin domain-containing protein n=1 Tax=Bombardia bombarda TaxID=252184 RepID=A0AA39XJR5_9PEZI|nr:Peroxin/Dysferlin domain-containing protein [Bombardia bombarda]